MIAKAQPRVSVLLPVYNTEVYLPAALNSILQQSFHDYEIIAIDDGSTDSSGAILDRLPEHRLTVVHQANAGLAVALNRAISLAKGEYLARQDADDIALPERFARQVEYLDANVECAVVGTWSTIWEQDRPTARQHRHPTDNGELQFRLIFDSFFVHSSVMMRSAAVHAVGGYPTDPTRCPPEDFDLWSRLARRFKVSNIPDVLQIYREIPTSIARSKREALESRAVKIAVENLQHALGDQYDGQLLELTASLVRRPGIILREPVKWDRIEALLDDLHSHFIDRFPTEQRAITRGYMAVKTIVREARQSNLPPSLLRRALESIKRHLL